MGIFEIVISDESVAEPIEEDAELEELEETLGFDGMTLESPIVRAILSSNDESELIYLILNGLSPTFHHSFSLTEK